MKKKIYSVLVLAILVLSVFLFAACSADDKNVFRAFIKPGTVQLQVMINDTLETENIVLVIEYKNGTSKEIKADKLEIADFDTTTLGFKTLTVTYKSLMAEIDIEVINESAKYVKTAYAIESKLLAEYNSRRAQQPQGSLVEFYDRNQPLYVGTDNAFNFRIEATGLDQFGNLVQKLQKVDAVITVEEKISENNYTLLEGENLDAFVEVDTLTVTFNFKKAAEGKTFKITVKAATMEEGYDEDAATIEAEVVVVEGYNVYTTKELSVYHNDEALFSWNSFKQQYGLNGITTNAIILQADLKLTKNDIPAEMMWQENSPGLGAVQALSDQPVVGSLIDAIGRGIYNRVVENGKQFNFIGNYFTVDVSLMPKIIVQSGNENAIDVEGQNYITSHATLFYNHLKDAATTTANTKINWKNINFVGNGTRDANPLSSGALMQSKFNHVNFEGYNTVTNSFYTTYFFELGNKNNDNNGHFLLNKVKAYNSFSTLMYIWGAKDVVIKNSEFVGAGGPAIIADHVSPTSQDGGLSSYVNIVNSKVESVISGQEPWFSIYPGTGQMVGKMAEAEAFFNGLAGLPVTTKTIIARTEGNVDEPIFYLNVPIAMKSGDMEGIAASRIKGKVNFFATELDYEKHYGLNGQEQYFNNWGLDMDSESSLINKAFGTEATYFESNGNGGYINDAVGINGDTIFPYDEGTHLNIYTPLGIGVIIELLDRPEA